MINAICCHITLHRNNGNVYRFRLITISLMKNIMIWRHQHRHQNCVVNDGNTRFATRTLDIWIEFICSAQSRINLCYCWFISPNRNQDVEGISTYINEFRKYPVHRFFRRLIRTCTETSLFALNWFNVSSLTWLLQNRLHLSSVSIFDKTSSHQVWWSLEAGRLVF